MSKRFYACIVVFVSLCVFISLSTASANTAAEMLIYTGKVAVTDPGNITTTYKMPQDLTEIPAGSTLECLDGIAILKFGEVQVIMEKGDKVLLTLQNDTNKADVICLAGEIEAIWGKDQFKIANGQTLALNSQGTPVVGTETIIDTPAKTDPAPRAKLSTTSPLMPDPVDLVHGYQYPSPSK
ncbi:hypothetical protein JXL19_10845 [bacterium]|nr:hypothetical protein [bacterium]